VFGHFAAQLPLAQRPDILAAEAAVRSAADAAGAASASMFPTLTLSASYGRGGFDWNTLSSPAGLIWSAGASITQPLFHGGALMARPVSAVVPWRRRHCSFNDCGFLAI
jgi:outer membrane protein TolC